MMALDDMMETAMDSEKLTPKMMKFTTMLEVVEGIVILPFESKTCAEVADVMTASAKATWGELT